jgi:malate dehydrogenase (oxaloacetate-decarboxylating)
MVLTADFAGSDALAAAVAALARAGGDLSAFDRGPDGRARFTVNARNVAHQKELLAALAACPGAGGVAAEDQTFLLHGEGKIEIALKRPLRTTAELSQAYTPGVARVCRQLHAHPDDSFRLTWRRNTIAVVTDGTAILGLGDLGPLAALPVMEGKALLFKEFGGVDAIPLCLDERDPDRFVDCAAALAPTLGGINLEDIAAPRCFAIEEKLQARVDIPVFHDDQHGTAIVTLAALENALRLVDKRLADVKIVIGGVGAAGTAVTKLLLAAGARRIVGADRVGALYEGRPDHMNPAKTDYARITNPEKEKGALSAILRGADVFIGLSGPGTVAPEDVFGMAERAVVFAMSNPDPEIAPEAVAGRVAVMATGRSDYPNQINNVLAFPGVFRGALDAHARRITPGMNLAAARAIAALAGDAPAADRIVPAALDKRVAPAVAAAVMKAAEADGVARPLPPMPGVAAPPSA